MKREDKLLSLWRNHLQANFPCDLKSDRECVQLDEVISKHLALSLTRDWETTAETILLLRIYCEGSPSPLDQLISRLKTDERSHSSSDIAYFERLGQMGRHMIELSDPA